MHVSRLLAKTLATLRGGLQGDEQEEFREPEDS
jgi:hypothetical protein